MKHLLIFIFIFSLLHGHCSVNKNENILKNPISGSCTIFAVSYGSKVLFGNNEDYNKPDTYYWVEPRSEGNYGCLYLGFENYSLQGGINEKGLAFDANALPGADINPHSELPSSPSEWIVKIILKKAASVKEAIDIAGRYQRKSWGIPLRYQVILADANGNAVVISAGKDGELAFTRKKKGDGFLVSTNFNRANPNNAYTYPCWRYDKAVEMLEKIKDENELTVDYCKSILDSVHVESARGNTLYSNIFDLKNGQIYLYHWHQYDETVILKLEQELKKESPPILIKDLFSKKTVEKAAEEYRRYKSQKN